jgi:hypothetical protein
MEPHPIAVIKPSAHDAPMELLLIALFLMALIGVLAQAGHDSRDADTRTGTSWW